MRPAVACILGLSLALAATAHADDDFETRVLGTRARDPIATRLTSKEILATPFRGAEDALRLVPGLVIVQHGSEGKGPQLFLRGFDASHGSDFSVSVEGIPLNEWSNVHAQGYLDLGIIIPEAVRSVTVIKGPFAPQQGAFSMAGSADYRLGVAISERGYGAHYTLGSTNRQRVVALLAPRENADLLAIEATHDDGFGKNRRVDRLALNGRKDLYTSDAFGRLSLLALGEAAFFQLPGLVRPDDVARGAIDFYGTYYPAGGGTSLRAVLAMEHAWRSNSITLQTTAYASYRELRLDENFTGFLLDQTHGDGAAQLQRGWPFGARSKLRVQAHRTLTLDITIGTRGDTLTQREISASGVLRRELNVVQTLSDAGVAARWNPVDALRVMASLRIDVLGIPRAPMLAAASPRVVVEWQPAPAWDLFAAYGRGFRPPEARAFTGFRPEQESVVDERTATTAPRMTTSDAFELGGRYSHRYVAASLVGFATLIARESIYDHVARVTLELNGTRRLGGELVVSVTPTPWLSFEGAVSLVDARFSESKQLLPYAPWCVGNVRAVLSHPSGIRAALRFLALAPRTLPHGAVGSSYTELDASVGYRFGVAHVDLGFENLLFQRLRAAEYYFASDWRLPGSVSSELPALHAAAGAPFNVRLTVGVTL